MGLPTDRDISLYFSTVMRGFPWAACAYLMVLLPPYPPIHWLRLSVTTGLFAVIVALSLFALRRAATGDAAQQARRMRVVILVETALACIAIANEMAGVERAQGSLIPLLLVIVVCNSVFQRGLDLVATWAMVGAAHLVGLLLAGEPGWLAVSSTVVFAGAVVGVQVMVVYVIGLVRSLNRELALERSVASDAAMFADRDEALQRMLPTSAELLGVSGLAIVRVVDGQRQVVARTSERYAFALHQDDRGDWQDGPSFNATWDGGVTARLSWPRGETPDARHLDAVCALVAPVLARAVHVDRLEGLAYSDSLTGLANRRRLDVAMEAWADTDFGLIVIDLDRFKAFNDARGHAAGDDVLRRAATVIRSVTREQDLAARFGGEEFCCVVPGTDITTLVAMERRLRDAWRRHDLPVTFSAGLAVRADGETPEATFRRADDALYRAKRGGRDAAVVA